jgi:hypothetical protein
MLVVQSEVHGILSRVAVRYLNLALHILRSEGDLAQGAGHDDRRPEATAMTVIVAEPEARDLATELPLSAVIGPSDQAI